MTAPGGASGDGGQGEQSTPPAAASNVPYQPSGTPWEPPGYTPASYGPTVDYPTGYTQDYPIGQAAPFATTGYPPPPQSGPPQYGPPGPWSPPGSYPVPGSYPGGYHQDYAGGYGAPGAVQGATNGMAIASLIISFSGFFCCVGSIVAIALGTIALDQVKRNRQEGYGLAVAGIVLGVAGLVIAFVVVLFAMQTR